mmetsp:Transcript_1649/g.3614  ORF Transcript_1649/g.3614 Transcript_1649/m.3614 type:complete len:218 (+) Transcript_1649:535-1188(+)
MGNWTNRTRSASRVSLSSWSLPASRSWQSRGWVRFSAHHSSSSRFSSFGFSTRVFRVVSTSTREISAPSAASSAAWIASSSSLVDTWTVMQPRRVTPHHRSRLSPGLAWLCYHPNTDLTIQTMSEPVESSGWALLFFLMIAVGRCYGLRRQLHELPPCVQEGPPRSSVDFPIHAHPVSSHPCDCGPSAFYRFASPRKSIDCFLVVALLTWIEKETCN